MGVGRSRLQIPRFIWESYQLEEAEAVLPQAIKVDSILAPLLGRSSLNHDDFTSDPTDKKVAASLKHCFGAANLAVLAATCAVMTSQSLVKDFGSLAEMM